MGTNNRLRFASAAFALVTVACVSSPALANDPDTQSDANVLSRPRPEYDARGIHLASFYLFPSLTGGAAWTDNVFNSEFDRVSDIIYTADAQVRLNSDWDRHALNFVAEAKHYWYGKEQTQDRTDWNVGADARIDIARGSDLRGEAHYADQHEEYGSEIIGGLLPGDAAEPTEYTDFGGSASLQHAFNRLQFEIGGTGDKFTYMDTPRILPAVPPVFDNHDRDRLVTTEFAKIGYEVMPQTAFFVRGTFNQHKYDQTFDMFGFDHDSKGVTADAGADFMITHVLQGTLSAGYLQQTYDDPVFGKITGPAFGAGLKWFPTMLTTVSVDGARDVQDTSIAGASSYVSTRGKIGIDHELLRNFILSGSVGYENEDYRDITRTDDILSGKVAGVLLLNNYLHVEADWQYLDRTSDAIGFEYKRNDFALSLTGKM